MLRVSIEEMRKQVDEVTAVSSSQNILLYDEFIKSLIPLYKKGELPDEIKVAKDEDSLMAGDFEPAHVINIKDNLHLLDYNGMPMWHNQSSDELSLHGLGLIEGNKSMPSRFSLYDTNPHGNIGGATGHGKSVLANSLIITASLVHPPWLVQFYLSDPKIVEMKPYATGEFKLPHVDSVASTEDPEYAISVLEFLLEKMDKRAAIFERVGVKSIDSFNKGDHGLTMPMMVLVLDELKAMLQTAGRRAAHVDKLIQAFVAKARFAGGRCIMLSQGVVTELDPATMKNVNIRVALGCTPSESENLIGNPGAAVNLGARGKVTYNESPEKTLKQNVYITTPFLPDKANEHTNNIYDIFKYQQEVWEKLTYPGARISPLSFFDQTAPLTKTNFQEEIKGKVSMSKIYLGEPVYINKTEDKMTGTSLEPFDKYSDNLANNILFMSSYSKHRLNFLATLLTNFDELKKIRKVDLRVYSPLKPNNDTIADLGFKVDGYRESGDVEGAFQTIIQQTLLKILMIKSDETVFDGRDAQANELTDKLVDLVKKEIPELTTLMERRVRVFIELMQEQTSIQVFNLPGELMDRDDYMSAYLTYAVPFVYMYGEFGCEFTQITAANTPIDIRVFFNYHLLNGTEVKTNRKLDLWMTVLKTAPVYGVHFVFISDMLPTSGASLNGNFNKIIYYKPVANAVAQHKLSDDYPDSSLDIMYIYADKTKTANKCVKVKLVEMLD